jgi:hypothetical protein
METELRPTSRKAATFTGNGHAKIPEQNDFLEDPLSMGVYGYPTVALVQEMTGHPVRLFYTL